MKELGWKGDRSKSDHRPSAKTSKSGVTYLQKYIWGHDDPFSRNCPPSFDTFYSDELKSIDIIPK